MCSIISPYLERLKPKSKLLFLFQKCLQNKGTFFSRIPPQSEGREALCLPNLLAGGLPAGLALAADKRAQHTHATQKEMYGYAKRDITAAIETGGRPAKT